VNESGQHQQFLLNPQIRLLAGADHCRENLPTATEVAAIVPDSQPQQGGIHPRAFRLALRRSDGASSYTRIDTGNPLYSPLHYVLLFPHGDHGWHWDLQMGRGQ
jgi:hypothetical protein